MSSKGINKALKEIISDLGISGVDILIEAMILSLGLPNEALVNERYSPYEQVTEFRKLKASFTIWRFQNLVESGLCHVIRAWLQT